MYHDAYAHLYQKMQGFRVKIFTAEKDVYLDGSLSLKPSTRSTYDIAMRDATIDGLLTMDKIEELKPGQIFYRLEMPSELFIIQSVNKFEFQKQTRNINAVKQNSFITIQRKDYDEILNKEIYKDIYSNLISFVTMQNKDEKNFAAGIEDNTMVQIQFPKIDLQDNVYDIKVEDRIILTDISRKISKKVKIESVNMFGVPGVTMVAGTFDTRTGE